MAPAPRGSKRIDELVRYVAETTRPGLRLELRRWIVERPRFGAFLEANQDKVRKKMRTAGSEEARLDVRAELLVAYLILADRRFDLTFEAYGSRQAGPDLTATYRSNQRVNLEVTRLRGASEPSKLADVIAAKVRQLPAELPNVLVIAARDATNESPAEAMRLLKSRVETRDSGFLASRGYTEARELFARFARLAGVFVLDNGVVFAANHDARRPLPAEPLTRLIALLRAEAPVALASAGPPARSASEQSSGG